MQVDCQHFLNTNVMCIVVRGICKCQVVSTIKSDFHRDSVVF